MISQLLDGNKESLVEKLGKKNDNIVVVDHGNFVYDWMMRMLVTRM
jgi:ribose 5-phosphate isomerase